MSSVSTRSAVNPGSTASSRAKLRSTSPAPVEQHDRERHLDTTSADEARRAAALDVTRAGIHQRAGGVVDADAEGRDHAEHQRREQRDRPR